MAEFQYEMSEYRQVRWPWKKIFICFLGAVLILVGTFFGGYFRGIEIGKRNHKHEDSSPVSEKLTRTSWKQESCTIFSRQCPDGFSDPPVLLISLDGFRPAYFHLNTTPSLNKLIQCGTFAKMRPVFPSKTFPNHYTIVTGLYPESHGIIDNRMIDPKTKAMFQIGNNETFSGHWWEGEPIWVTAEKQGIKTGTLFWPGSDVEIKGTSPTYFLMYNDKLSWECRVDTILSWLDLPSNRRPAFMTLYVNEPDNTAHKHGPESNEVKKALRRVDLMIYRLMKGLHERNLLGCINVVITSDHGMSSTSCERVFALDKYVNISTVNYIVGATSRLRPKNSSQVTVDSLLDALTCQERSIMAFRKEKLPLRYHYSHNPRIEPIVLDMEPGWLVFRSSPEEGKVNYCNGGAHGYDNMASDMQAIFLASGPSFKQGFTADPFLNVEVYNLMTELLNITALPNNGTRGRLNHILKHPPPIVPTPKSSLNDACSHQLDENNNAETGCICEQQQIALNILDNDINFKLHLPWGIPKTESTDDDSYVCLLKNKDYISGFHRHLKLPIWTSFTISSADITHNEPSSCWMADPRIKNSLTCFDFAEPEWNNVTPQPVFPYEFTSYEAGQTLNRLLTNVVPKFNFTVTIDKYLHTLIANYIRQYGSVNIVTGPAFDKKMNGEKNTVDEGSPSHKFPTHYFTIVTFCVHKDTAVHHCSASDLDVIGFLLPNEAFPPKCQDYSHYLVYHSASVKDVQSVTGLQFYSELPPYKVIWLQTRLPTES